MTRQTKLAVAILAAGKGTRMKSSLPKVLHVLGGRSLLGWVLHGLRDLAVDRTLVIVGYRADEVKAALAGAPGVEFIAQTEQLGTGHAVQQVLPHLEGFEGDLLVLNGDVPLLRPESLRAMITAHRSQHNAATVLTARLPNPKGYGRVFCDEHHRLTQIIEDRDCTPEQRQNDRVNAGIYCFRWPDLAQALPRLSTNNDQQEYYLTEVVDYLDPVVALDVADYQETLGINDRKQLAQAYQILQTRQKDDWMAQGVTLIDPDSITIDDTVMIGPDVVIEPQTHLRGATTIGAGCRIGPSTMIENSQIGDRVQIPFSVVTDSRIGNDSRIGPYAHLRGQAQVGEGCRVGNFVEIKNATLGNGTNAAHLSYLGDAQLGERVNVGAGTITANYDGFQKHKTVIGDRTKTGSNSVLVAPITIGQDVTIGAGSTLTKDVPDNALVVARAKQIIKPDWQPKPSQSAASSTPTPG
ncbi:MAG: bifunctional UDP-N-acetylglucosamine diphosphorylase/glucosamine-1-phosphate N-acetyltransferase GlmU [Synechococcales cyanobacterium CRU_2_2]|nr:bifunctional UDP-N-acetylglucosamine diphosphorylase/glucosamine-1-phosphate N-acetyltransferase GlmU [Synechococcales cyanobacterium CRU_2_2]